MEWSLCFFTLPYHSSLCGHPTTSTPHHALNNGHLNHFFFESQRSRFQVKPATLQVPINLLNFVGVESYSTNTKVLNLKRRAVSTACIFFSFLVSYF